MQPSTEVRMSSECVARATQAQRQPDPSLLLPVARSRRPAGRYCLVRLTLALFFALQLAIGWVSTSEAESGRVAFNEPALSPDGRLVAVQAWVPGHLRSRLVLYDTETGSVRTFDQPLDQTWRGPSFSLSGERLVFLQICRFTCTSGPKGVHIGILDLQSGRNTTVTTNSNLIRMDPIFAPGGRFIVYGTVQTDDVDRRSFPKSVYNRAYGFLTRSLYALDLDTGIEKEVLPGDDGGARFLRIIPAGFLDEKTLLIRGMSVIGGNWKDRLEQRVQHVRAIIGGTPEDEDYLYTVSFDESFVTASEIPRARLPEIFETDWVRPVSHQVIEPGDLVSFDTGLMTFIDRSERNRKPCLFGCNREYDVFLGDETTIRQVTFLYLEKMYDATISRSGNRVAFFVRTDNRREELWMHDVSSGRTWRTELREQLIAIATSASDRN